MDLKALMEEFKETTGQLKGLLDQQSQEIKLHGETSEKTAKSIEDLDKRITAMSEEIKELQLKGGRPGYGDTPKTRRSAGEIFVDSEQYKGMIARGAKSCDPVMLKEENGDGNGEPEPPAPPIPVGSFDTDGNSLVAPHWYPQIIGPQDRALRIRDLIPTSPTTSNAIEYVEETGYTVAADVVPEGEVKPASELEFGLRNMPVETIAHWIPATRQIISDAAQMRAYIDNRLVYGLKMKEEDKLIYGTGSNGDIQGIATHSGIQTYDWSDGVAGDTKVDAIRRAITLARLAEYPVTGIILNPADWEEIELTKGSDGRYLWVTVPEGGQTRLWRVPVVETTAIESGECLLGAFGLGAMIWDREQASIRISEHHDDYFIRNMLAVLAEERLALTIFRPQAFVLVDFDEAPGNGGAEG